jgi:hypothetical protein
MKLQLLALSISTISLTSIIAAPIMAIATAVNPNLNFDQQSTKFSATNLTLLAQRSGEGTTRDVDTNTNATPQLRKINVLIIRGIAGLGADRSLARTLVGQVNAPDLYVKVKINGQTLPPTSTANNSFTHAFNTIRSSNVPSIVSSVPIEISLLDDDLIGENTLDISSTSDRVLKLRYIPNTGKIIGPLGTEMGQAGQEIVSAGNSNNKHGKLHFKITHGLP